MRRNKLLFTLAGILLSLVMYGQQSDGNGGKSAQSFYLEGGGPGLVTINYDQRLKGSMGLGFRAGMGGYGVGKKGLFTVPLGMNYTTGSGSHFAEVGAGLCYVASSTGNSFFDNTGNYVLAYFNFGYRFQQPTKGLTYRIFLSPLLTPAGVVPFYAGASFGVKF
jgi:hypothetical protein